MTYCIKQVHKVTEQKHKLLLEYDSIKAAGIAANELNEAFPEYAHSVINGNIKLEVDTEVELPREGYHP